MTVKSGRPAGELAALLSRLKGEDYCYLTTTGRASGRPHEIEIWFACQGESLYMLSGGGARSDWVKNLLADPNVTVRIGENRFAGRARIVDAAQEDMQARQMVAAKYQGWREGHPLSQWARTALPVAIDLTREVVP